MTIIKDTSRSGFKELFRPLAAVLFSRLVLNTARRFAYPFAPVLSRGLGVPLSAMTALIAVNQATGVLAIFFGPLSDRIGYRRMMMIALTLLILGMAVGGAFPVYVAVLAALFAAGMAKNVYDAAVQAYVGERVPFHRRGAAIGLIELSWAASTFIGVPVLGLAIARFGWRSPFFILAMAGMVGLAATFRWISPDRSDAGAPDIVRSSPLKAVVGLFRHRTALGAMGFAFFISAANDNIFVVYGAWLESSFDLGVAALGMSTMAIGGAELCGEVLTATLADRLGLKRAVLLGTVLTAAAFVLLPFAGASLPLALGALFILFLCFEFTIVSALTLGTELMPEARATMMAGFLAMAGIGRFVGALAGGVAWTYGGLRFTAVLSMVTTLLALASLAWGLRHWEREGAEGSRGPGSKETTT
ncbi:MAG: MFS transporter [Pseudomonadota bacterium]